MAVECSKSQLAFFEPRNIQFSVLKTETISLKPLASLDNAGVIEFRDSGYSDHYRNLSTIYLHLKVKMTYKGTDGKVIDTATTPLTDKTINCVPVCNLLHALFKQVTLTLNNQRVAVNGQNYAFR